MDLLVDDPPLNLNDPKWRIFSRNPNEPACYISKEARVRSSIVNEGCVVHGDVNRSVLFYGVEVGEGSEITDSVIMPKVKIGKNVKIHKAIVSENMIIGDGTTIGGEDQDEILLVDEAYRSFEII